MCARRRRGAGPVFLVAALSLAGCASSRGTAAAAGSSVASPTPSRDAAAAELAARATRGTSQPLTLTYTAVAGKRQVQVKVWVSTPERYRVDVVQQQVTSSLFGTASGAVACSSAPGVAPACFTVAAKGQPVPSLYDAGVQGVFTTDLPVLAVRPEAFTVAAGAMLPAAGKLPAAQCFSVSGRRPGVGVAPLTEQFVARVDLGTYCLTTAGVPRRLTFASGTLTLTAAGGPPAAAALRPPATPRPLPTATRSAG